MAEERGISEVNKVPRPVDPAGDQAAELPGELSVTPPSRWKRRVTLIAAAVTLIAAGIVLPPLINIGRYQRQITALVSRSVGRPVHLSSVDLRLLPSPGFVLHDLSISEDPAFGPEPVLSARTVVASVRIFSLWRGKMEISRISVDEASLNLVRAADGRWNLESLMMGADPALTSTARDTGTQAQASANSRNFPYLEATNSRVNLKNGLEKSPYSLVNTDLSLWQDDPGQWRVRLLGQPVRTDIEMSQADAGEVRLEASLGSAPQLRDMPLKLQMDWRDAQLGQLSRLASGSDAGWRGDVTADIDVHGTLDAAQTKARLRATGVHREEFAPETSLDLDANCSFRYQHSQSAFHEVGCDTAIGDGRLHLKAEVPGQSGPPQAMLEVRQVPLQAVLDVLRTVRGGFAPGISAKGTVQGSLTYQEPVSIQTATAAPQHLSLKGKQKPIAANTPAALTGSLTLTGGILKGGSLKDPLTLPASILWTPGTLPDPSASGIAAIRLGTQFNLILPPVSAAAPPAPAQSLAIRFGASMRGYDAAASGTAAPSRVRDLAYAFGLAHLDAADALSGGTVDLDMQANGPWLYSGLPSVPANASDATPTAAPASDILATSLKLHHVQWRAPYLARSVDLAQGTVSLLTDRLSLTSDFTYGDPKSATKANLKGTAEISAPLHCATSDSPDCQPQVSLHFCDLDVASLQNALLGAPTEKSLLAPLLNRIRSEARPKWPALKLTVDAESLNLGPTSLHKPTLHLQVKQSEIVIEAWNTDVLGGAANGTGQVDWPGSAGGSPRYALTGDFTGISPSALGALLGAEWSGGAILGTGDIALSGLTSQELAATAAGHLKFNWAHGALAAYSAPPVHFERWSGSFNYQGGKGELGENTLVAGKRSSSVKGTITFGGPAKLAVGDTVLQTRQPSPAKPTVPVLTEETPKPAVQ